MDNTNITSSSHHNLRSNVLKNFIKEEVMTAVSDPLENASNDEAGENASNSQDQEVKRIPESPPYIRKGVKRVLIGQHSNETQGKLKKPDYKDLQQCDFCLELISIFTKFVYRQHLSQHAGEKPYRCYICGEGFGEARFLENHVGEHAGNGDGKPIKGGNRKRKLRDIVESSDGEIAKKTRKTHKAKDIPSENESVQESPVTLKVEIEEPEELEVSQEAAQGSDSGESTEPLEDVDSFNQPEPEPSQFQDAEPEPPDPEDQAQEEDNNETAPTSQLEAGMEGTNEANSPANQPDQTAESALTKPKGATPMKTAGRGRKLFINCDICGKLFRNSYKLRMHRMTHTGEKPFKCDNCGRGFNNPFNLRIHMRVHTDSNAVSCEYCGKQYTITCMRKHQKTKHPEEFAAKQRAKKEEELVKKLVKQELKKTVQKERMFRCKICLKEFDSQYKYNCHRSTHGSGLPTENICMVCSKVFPTQHKLEQHMKVHSGEHPYECSACGAGHKSEAELQYHADNYCDAPQPPGEKVQEPGKHRCNICGKNFTTPHSLRYHILRHNGEEPYPCDVCNKRFVTKSKLKHHIATHNEERSYTCQLCPKAYRTKAYLREHMQVHKDADKPYKCDFCDMRFRLQSRLKVHLMTHSDQRSHICDVCGRGFIMKHNMMRHMMIHTGTKEHKCTYCDRDFREKSTLEEHMRVHTGEKPFQCSTCGNRFRYVANWRQHSKKCAANGRGMVENTKRARPGRRAADIATELCAGSGQSAVSNIRQRIVDTSTSEQTTGMNINRSGNSVGIGNVGYDMGMGSKDTGMGNTAIQVLGVGNTASQVVGVGNTPNFNMDQQKTANVSMGESNPPMHMDPQLRQQMLYEPLPNSFNDFNAYNAM